MMIQNKQQNYNLLIEIDLSKYIKMLVKKDKNLI